MFLGLRTSTKGKAALLPFLATATITTGLLTGCGNTDNADKSGSTAATATTTTQTTTEEPTTTSSTTPTPTPTTPAPTEQPAEPQPAMASKEAIAAHHAGKFVEILLTNYDAAAAAVDLGVRHFFIGSNTDLSILNGVGDPGRSLAALEARAGEPLRISVDEEGGLVQRLNQYTGALPSARQMASTMSPQQVQNLMYDHGRKIRALGITVDYAPVVDLAGGANISDNAIGSRSFSADPWVVEQYARAYAQGLIDAGITPVLKHFPGHGRANGDSHHATVVTPPLSDMHHADLVPYAQLGHLPGIQIMMGHMIVPELGEPIPTSINPAAYQLLRSGQYGQNAPTFSGVVTTDDLTGMRAITNHHTPEQAVVAAIAAGADRALAASGPVNTASVIEAIRLAILEQRIPTEHANWALYRMGWAPQG